MWIVKLISGLLSVIEAAFSAYSRAMAVEEGKRMVREEMYEQMVESIDRAKAVHDTSLDELISLRSAKTDGNRHKVSDNKEE